MLTPDEQHRACIGTGDTVAFHYRGRKRKGVVVRTNPTRAIIRTDDEDYTVPYERLLPEEHLADERVRRIESIKGTAQQLMAQHGLEKWRFRFDHATRRAGACNYRDKVISISFDLARNGSEEDIRDTILHEIAHALVGRKHNHNAVWQAKAREIGCSGERTHRLEFSPPKWRVRCANRCWESTAQRRNHRLVCRQCGGKLVYSAYG